MTRSHVENENDTWSITKPSLAALILIIVLLIPGQSAFGENAAVTQAGDTLQFLMPALALGSTLVANGPDGGWVDREGFYQATKSQLATLITQSAWKRIAMGYRPNLNSQDSFPSGHTTGACSAGDFLTTRYWDTDFNWLWATIGQAGCLFTAYSRVQANAHFINDVTASYGLSWMYNLLFVTPKGMTNNVSVMPMPIGGGGTGIALQVSEGSGEEPSSVRRRYERERSRPWRFTFGWGPAFMGENEVTAPADNGTTFNLDKFENVNNPINTALLGLYYDANERNTIYTEFYPLETTDMGTFSTPVNFNGTTFPANETVNSRWRQIEFRAGWSHDLGLHPDWITRLGLELELQYLSVELQSDTPSLDEQVNQLHALPLLTGSFGYRISPRLSIQLDIDGIWLGNNSLLDSGIYFSYKPTPRWEWHLGYRYYQQSVSEENLKNKFTYHMPILAVSYLW